jgi:galactokinase
VRGVIAGVLDRPAVALRAPTQIAFAGDVPIGFGVSSSAALCVGLALALTANTLPPKELVLLAQEGEHRAGTPCGTMDQSASVAGGIIRFDGATLDCEQLTPNLGGLVFAVADSGVKRSLGASSYPIRVKESAAALAIANEVLGRQLPHLAALTPDDLDALETHHREKFPESLLARARHVVTETVRVEQGMRALRASDWETFGALMTASGQSSATDYAISHPRVEELVAEALSVPGVLGARMMGGGEGGTALLLLPRDRVAALEQVLCAGYFARYQMAERDDLIHVCAYAPGAHGESL